MKTNELENQEKNDADRELAKMIRETVTELDRLLRLAHDRGITVVLHRTEDVPEGAECAIGRMELVDFSYRAEMTKTIKL